MAFRPASSHPSTATLFHPVHTTGGGGSRTATPIIATAAITHRRSSDALGDRWAQTAPIMMARDGRGHGEDVDYERIVIAAPIKGYRR